jgi:chemotaxis protein CheD
MTEINPARLPSPLTLPLQRVQWLHPGDVAMAERGERLDTLLGSCVAVLLSDPQRTMGVMCHIVHAVNRRGAPPGDTRYGPAALERMLELMTAKGYAASKCQAWLCGGGNMFPQQITDKPIGEANVLWVREQLHRLGVRVVSESVGGAHYRKVIWTVGNPAPDIDVMPVHVTEP